MLYERGIKVEETDKDCEDIVGHCSTCMSSNMFTLDPISNLINIFEKSLHTCIKYISGDGSNVDIWR